MEVVYSKNDFTLAKIFVLRPFKNDSKSNSAPGLNRGLSWNFWWQKIANHTKLKCVMYIAKHVLVKKKKNVYKQPTLFKEGWKAVKMKTVYTRQTHNGNTPEMVDTLDVLILADKTSYKRGHFWTAGNFSWYSIYNCALWPTSLRTIVIWFHQDNAKPHTATKSVGTISQFD